jgi:hypothetical protein
MMQRLFCNGVSLHLLQTRRINMGIEMQTPLYLKIITLVGGMLVVFLMAGWELVNKWITGVAKAIFRSSHSGTKKPIRST